MKFLFAAEDPAFIKLVEGTGDAVRYTGGEDYALLAAIAPGVALPRDTVVVGRIIEGAPGVIALRGGCDVTPVHLGWEHGHHLGL